jgi:hypothetical protein
MKKLYFKLRYHEGEGKRSVNEKIARHVWNEIRERELDGKVGKEKTNTHDELIEIICKFVEEKRWITIGDKTSNVDRYRNTIEKIYSTVMNDYLMNASKKNLLRYQGLLNNPRVGYYIAASHEETKEYRENRKDILEAMNDATDERCIDVDRHIDLITSGENIKQLERHQEVD